MRLMKRCFTNNHKRFLLQSTQKGSEHFEWNLCFMIFRPIQIVRRPAYCNIFSCFISPKFQYIDYNLYKGKNDFSNISREHRAVDTVAVTIDRGVVAVQLPFLSMKIMIFAE